MHVTLNEGTEKGATSGCKLKVGLGIKAHYLDTRLTRLKTKVTWRNLSKIIQFKLFLRLKSDYFIYMHLNDNAMQQDS